MEDDIAAWNLAWLSFPALDLYLQPGSTHAVIMQMINPQLLGTLQAMASPGLAQQYPGLRAALLDHPKGLGKILAQIDLMNTPAGKIGGRVWVGDLHYRLHGVAASVLQSVPDNVVYYDFAAKRQKG